MNKMSGSSNVLVLLLMSAAALNIVLGFSPYAPAAWGRGNVARTNANSGDFASVTMTATVEKEDAMTTDDEDFLFGDGVGGSSGDAAAPPFPSRKRHVSLSGNLLPDRSQPLNPLDHSSKDPLVNKLRTVRDRLPSCPALWSELAALCPDKTAIIDEHCSDEIVDYDFRTMDDVVRRSAAAFRSLGVEKGDHVAILGENSAMWLMADHGVQAAGGVSAVRGADAPLDELRYVYSHSDSKAVAVLQGPRLLKKLATATTNKDNDEESPHALGLHNDKHGEVRTIVLLNTEGQSDEKIADITAHLPNLRVVTLRRLLDEAEPATDRDLPTLDRTDLATIVYTSGTTGRPKGVMLTHGNLLHQTGHRLAPTRPYDETEPVPGDVMLSLLPVWHITERSFEIWIWTRGAHVVYSTVRSFRKDLEKFQPHWMVLVPRVMEKVATGVQNKFASGSAAVKTLSTLFTKTGAAKNKHSMIAAGRVVGDTPPSFLARTKSRLLVAALAPLNALGNKLVWSKVQNGFGGRQKLIISGGSALSGALESFYQTAGIPIVVGYGLTECSPLLSHRRSDANLITPGCVGPPCLDTEVRVVDPELSPDDGERPALPDGVPGRVLGRGPQLMRGYYANPDATREAIDRFGWFDTGDLGRINPATGDLVLTGRAKDTIVLSNGENVEPTPIEDAVATRCAPLLDQIMLAGQDGRSLAAVVVLNPTECAAQGFLDQDVAADAQRAYDDVNDPTCTEDRYAEAIAVLDEACARTNLRENAELQKELLSEMGAATRADFRPWEQVASVVVTLEPFAMVNGLLTQSYKVKRDAVTKRYEDEL